MLDYFQNLIANCAVEWRPIPGYEGHYEASSSGLVRSCDRPSKYRDTVTIRGTLLRMYERKSGVKYRSVGLSKDGATRTMLVHDAVFCAFNGVPENRRKMTIDHRDGNEHNNAIGNLVLITAGLNVSKRKATSPTYGIWKQRNRWVADIIKDKKKIHIGTFPTKEEALSARIAKEKELLGEFAPIRDGVT